MKYLIVNADDFGLSKSINKGIINAHLNGIVTSASLMANGEAFEDAVSLIHRRPALAVGIHFVLTEEKPVLPQNEVPSLVDKNGHFFRTYRQFFQRLLTGRINNREIKNEFNAQLNKLLRAGIKPSHADGHDHLHIFPSILNVLLEIAKTNHIQWIRNSHDTLTAVNDFSHLGLAVLGKFGKKKILGKRCNTSNYFLGTRFSGKLNESNVLHMLDNLRTGVSEIMCHPGEENRELIAKYGHWNYHWKDEQIALTSAAVKARIARRDLLLTNYRELSSGEIDYANHRKRA